MVNESVILATWFDEHWYRIIKDSIAHFIASVTTKLSVERKEGIDRWRGDLGNRESDLRMYEASQRGKRIHYAWWVYVNGGTVVYNPWESPIYSEETIEEMRKASPKYFMVLTSQDEMVQVWKLQRFYEAVNPKVLHTETIVYDIPEDIAGTLDDAFLIEKGTYPVNGSKGLVIPKTGIYIADLKTGRTVDDNVWRQLAPYAYAYERMGMGKVTGAIVLHTSAQTKSGIQGLAVPLRMAEELKEDFEDYKHLAAIWKKNNPNAGPMVFDFPSIIKRK